MVVHEHWNLSLNFTRERGREREKWEKTWTSVQIIFSVRSVHTPIFCLEVRILETEEEDPLGRKVTVIHSSLRVTFISTGMQLQWPLYNLPAINSTPEDVEKWIFLSSGVLPSEIAFSLPPFHQNNNCSTQCTKQGHQDPPTPSLGESTAGREQRWGDREGWDGAWETHALCFPLSLAAHLESSLPPSLQANLMRSLCLQVIF